MSIYDIRTPEDIKSMSIKELEELAEDIRSFLIQSISKTGGHLSSNLGVVELMTSLFSYYNFPKENLFQK